MHIWSLPREQLIKLLTTRKINVWLYMVTDVNQISCDDHFQVYTNFKLFYCTPDTNIWCQLYIHLRDKMKKYLSYQLAWVMQKMRTHLTKLLKLTLSLQVNEHIVVYVTAMWTTHKQDKNYCSREQIIEGNKWSHRSFELYRVINHKDISNKIQVP